MYDEADAGRRWRVMLIADGAMEPALATFLRRHRAEVRNWELFAPTAIGAIVREVLGPRSRVTLLGPVDDEARAAAEIAAGEIDALILLRAPLAPRPAEPGLPALLGVADVYNVPVATNLASAECLVCALSPWHDHLAARAF